MAVSTGQFDYELLLKFLDFLGFGHEWAIINV